MRALGFHKSALSRQTVEAVHIRIRGRECSQLQDQILQLLHTLPVPGRGGRGGRNRKESRGVYQNI